MTSETKEQNNNAFKHLFNDELLQQLGELIKLEHPKFNAKSSHALAL